jgi:acyl-CoA thioesterase 8
VFYISDVEKLQQALEQDSLPPKYREYVKMRIEESSPVDYREIDSPKQSLEQVRQSSFHSVFT